MSCGNHHDRDCGEVLGELYRFIDHELDAASTAQIQQHLDECGPCLREHELDLIVQRLVARSCAVQAPQTLRNRVLLTLHQVVQVDVHVDVKMEIVDTDVQPHHPYLGQSQPDAQQRPGAGGLPWQLPPGRL